eukprot:1178839-Prorocentrum_minimum.AAC.5
MSQLKWAVHPCIAQATSLAHLRRNSQLGETLSHLPAVMNHEDYSPYSESNSVYGKLPAAISSSTTVQPRLPTPTIRVRVGNPGGTPSAACCSAPVSPEIYSSALPVGITASWDCARTSAGRVVSEKEENADREAI